jgi:hypothetical protein
VQELWGHIFFNLVIDPLLRAETAARDEFQTEIRQTVHLARLINLHDALDDLKQTSFRASSQLFELLVRPDSE